MKCLFCILFLTVISCKTAEEKQPKPHFSVLEMWNAYTNQYPETATSKPPVSWFFHNNEKDANRLGKLVALGKKQASSGLYVWYEEANAPLPESGVKHIITDFNGKALAIIETKKVDTIPFIDISPAYAKLDMGTTENPLEKWKKAHWDFFTMALAESNQKPTEEMLVVCEYFETIWPKKVDER